MVVVSQQLQLFAVALKSIQTMHVGIVYINFLVLTYFVNLGSCISKGEIIYNIINISNYTICMYVLFTLTF